MMDDDHDIHDIHGPVFLIHPDGSVEVYEACDCPPNLSTEHRVDES